jgi:hypothetical protein
MDRVAVGSPLSLVIANFFMEDSEELTLSQVANKPIYWFYYTDDISDLASWTRKAE